MECELLIDYLMADIVTVFSSAATQKRVRHEPRTTLRRRTSTRSRYATGTARRMSTNVQDAAVAMMPDLSENLSNEERTWEEIMQIKAMPISMFQKIQLKRQLQVNKHSLTNIFPYQRQGDEIKFDLIVECHKTETPRFRAAEMAA